MRLFKICYKFVLFCLYIGSFILSSYVYRIFVKDQLKRRKYFLQSVSFFCRLGLGLLGFEIKAINLPAKDKPYLLAGNHLGMLDILAVAGIKPTLFVTSVELKNTPGLGVIAEMSGCLYVERRDRSNIQNELTEIREALSQGCSVALYPEGTSTNGERVLPFKKTLLTSAAGTGVPILPMVVNYVSVNGEPMSHKWRDYVCWYGDDTFFASLIRIFQVDSVVVEIEFLNPVVVESEDQRKEVAAQVQHQIVQKYRKIPLPPGVESLYKNIPEAL
jgi:1-acyl-sn-glycerol-3-phosphate acyltransferase